MLIYIAAPIKPEMESVIETLKKIEIPICSIDIPSGNGLVYLLFQNKPSLL
jgi:NAD(P)H-hydrate repair Nnr-like enzyme with NAD(P)H-hydrate epimerase domain